MKELQEILARIKQLEPNEKAVLATVVDVRGSSYRLPGAKMLILENGQTFGTVSGGCLEADVLERAKKVLKNDEPSVFTYDTIVNEDSVFSLNMGCRGIIRILLEPIRADGEYLKFLENYSQSSSDNAITATLIAASSNSSNNVGARLLYGASGFLASDFDIDLNEKLLPVVQKAFGEEKSKLETIESTEFFVEFIKSTLSFFIFGAGADAVPLANFAKQLGWLVTVIDHRPAFANPDRFPTADQIVISRPDDFEWFTAATASDGNYAAVVMTHNYEHDKEIIWRLLSAKAKYIGALGPKRRIENILREFGETGKQIPIDNLQKLYAPVGLDIGANTPEAIALSIVAEINAVLADRNGGFLRNRSGSIYGRNAIMTG